MLLHKWGVDMILCFGIFARILNCCRQDVLPGVKFVPKIAWVVDRKNSSLAVGLKDEVKDEELDDMEGNSTVVTKLLSCERPLVIKSKRLPSIEEASKDFKSKVMPHINGDKIAKAVLAVLYIISKDETIVNERKETFRKFVGMYKDELLQQIKFDPPDFFARVLLYTTCVNNEEGCPYVKEITDDFIEKVAAALDSRTELKWDTTTKTAEIIRLTGIQSWMSTIESLSFDYYAQLLRSHHKWDHFYPG